MDTLSKKFEDFRKALLRLEEAYDRAKNADRIDYPFFRDSAIQRFEFTVEAFWKYLKEFLRVQEGKVCNSPKSCIREYMSSGYISEEDAIILLKMIDDKNMTSHTYHEEVAEIIFGQLNLYISTLEKIEKYEND